MNFFEIAILIVGGVVLFIIGLAYIAPYLVDEETRQILQMQDEMILETEGPPTLNKAPTNNKEYILNDGSTVTIDAAKTEVEEKEVFDPFGDEVLKPQKSPSERMGGGIAEIIRKRREEGVF